MTLTCDQPTITNGTVTPASATVEQGQSYEISCDSGFTISGATTMICRANGSLSDMPTCEGMQFDLNNLILKLCLILKCNNKKYK